MLYVEYDALRIKYKNAQRQYDEILQEQEELFIMTQPGGMDYSKERVNGGKYNNPFDAYLIAKETKQIDERLNEIKAIMDERKTLLDLKEKELRESNDWNDKIYTLYYLDRLSITQLESRIPYSRTQIWRKLNIIKQNIGDKPTPRIK